MTTPYTTGTITLTNGSAVVTGAGTAWQTALIVGGIIYAEAAGGNSMPILTVDSDTQITAAVKWKGATGSYSYALVIDTAYDRQVLANATTLAQIIQALNKPSISSISALTPAADKVPYFTGSNTAALATLTTFARTMLDDADASAVLSTLGVSTFIKTFLDDADSSAALSTLGVSTYIKGLLDDADAAAARATLNTAWEPIGNEISLGGLSSAAFVLPPQYKAFKLLLYQITPTASILTTARTSIDGGASYAVGASDYSYLIVSTIAAAAQPATGSAAAANLVFTGTLQGNNGRVAGEITIDPGSGSQFPTFIGKTCGVSSGTDLRMFDFVTRREVTQRINAFALFCSSGSWVVGFARLMGMRS
ncbi:hypothetical protein [Rhizobium rhizogenes]|uniref:hypothetical protein n=1 Tax=Rhizobium rhizogenes TaxID=359 RepID=UPI0024BE2EE3|nr:hypothetical protein [Rhizobium rhizogenes]MDJ1632667.1 hypothetical protein [Rhizobium rhizogenes]